jgi:hypothetical protein
MSAEAYKAVRDLSTELWSRIEEARMAIPEKRRPSICNVQLVLRELAWGFIDDRGYADPTLAQISKSLRRCSVTTVSACIKVLCTAGVVLILRPATRGLDGEPGRAPRYGFSFFSPKRRGKTEVDIRPAEQSDSELLPIEQLRLEVARLDEAQRNGPTEFQRQQARFQWVAKHEELRRRGNV